MKPIQVKISGAAYAALENLFEEVLPLETKCVLEFMDKKYQISPATIKLPKAHFVLGPCNPCQTCGGTGCAPE